MKNLTFLFYFLLCVAACDCTGSFLDNWEPPKIEVQISGVSTGGLYDERFYIPPFNGVALLEFRGVIGWMANYPQCSGPIFEWNTYIYYPPYHWWKVYVNFVYYWETDAPWGIKVLAANEYPQYGERTHSFFHTRKVSCVGNIAWNFPSNGINFVGKNTSGCLYEGRPYEDCVYMNGHFEAKIYRKFDFSGDGVVDILDFAMLASRFGKPIADIIEHIRFDVDMGTSSGATEPFPVWFGDIGMFCENWLVLYEPQTYGDYNLDWKVNMQDFAILAESWMSDSNSHNELRLFVENYLH